ncbi:putative NADP(+)-dependent dehydrogenase [Xylariales sp. AK1849]|nr:putative NADP(+)-dependent dehydrogenase [Xylariales sp. AK1849]
MSFSYTTKTHRAPYAQISPSLPHLSAAQKTVFVAGGSAGIGKATAFAFLEAGCQRLALTGRRSEVLSSTAAEIAFKYPNVKVLTFAVDILDVAAMNNAFSEVKEKLGAADVVVNSAAAAAPIKPLASIDLGIWWASFETNVKSVAILAQAVSKHASATATVIQLSTAGALFPANAGLPMSSYASSKLAATKIIEYFGVENPSLRVMSVHPGILVDTEGGKKMIKESGMQWEGDDIDLPAHFLVWAASEEAAFLKNKFVFAAWDVEELKARKDEIANSPELILGLNGFPRQV